MIRFHKNYFILTVIFLLIEVLIALYVKEDFIRSYFGDFLVVMLIFFFLKTFIAAPDTYLAIPVLLFAYAVETLQYFHLIHALGLEKSELATVVLGNSFSWMDILAYTLGILAVLMIKRLKKYKFFLWIFGRD